MMETGSVFEWRIDNFSHWCAKVHGDCIKSPDFCIICYWSRMELYPKGINGKGEHLVAKIYTDHNHFSGTLSFYSSDGSLLCSEQQVKAEGGSVLELSAGPRFKDVLSEIRESGDFIIVRLQINGGHYEQRMCTTINVYKISLKIEPTCIEKMGLDSTKYVCDIHFSPKNYHDRMEFNIYSKNSIIHFMIKPPTKFEDPFAVEICMRLRRSDDTVDSYVKKEHIFHDNSPWTFLDPLKKKELDGKEISLFLCLKTRNEILSPSYMINDNSIISIVPNTFPCFPEKEPSTHPVTSGKTENSVEVLIKHFMCLYQDQSFSDITLKCDNITFPVHRAILSARSPVLDRLLSCDMKEAASGEVDIGDIDPSTLGLFLTYLYTGAVGEQLQGESALNLYYAADKYQVPSLKRECAEFLCDIVSISNVCDILSLANRHNDDHLTTVSHNFILNNYNDLLRSKEWETFMESDPLVALKTLTQLSKRNSVSFTPLP